MVYLDASHKTHTHISTHKHKGPYRPQSHFSWSFLIALPVAGIDFVPRYQHFNGSPWARDGPWRSHEVCNQWPWQNSQQEMHHDKQLHLHIRIVYCMSDRAGHEHVPVVAPSCLHDGCKCHRYVSTCLQELATNHGLSFMHNRLTLKPRAFLLELSIMLVITSPQKLATNDSQLCIYVSD